MRKFLEEFRAFALRGNVMDMAVGVIIGGAFSGIVTSLTDNFINPVLNICTGHESYSLQDAAGFLTYYDEIFTESFKTKLDQEAEQELFCSDGMISFGTGMIWFFPSSNGSGLEISTVNGLDGCSVRYG